MIGIDVVVVPVEIELTDATDHLSLPVRRDRRHLHSLAPEMHVGLEVLDPSVLFEHVKLLGRHDGIGWDEQISGATFNSHPEGEYLAVSWLLSFRVKVESEFDRVSDLLAGRRVVNIKDNIRAGFHELSTDFTHDLALFADGPFHEETGGDAGGLGARFPLRVIFLLLEHGKGVMRDAPAFYRRGANFDGAHPSVLGQPGGNDWFPPMVLGQSWHGVGCRPYDQVWWSAESLGKVPDVVVGKDRRWR